LGPWRSSGFSGTTCFASWAKSSAGEFASWFAPRINFFLNQLFGHHHIEDHHYFPVFMRAEPRLKRGFDILDSDHHILHEALENNADSARKFLVALQNGRDQARQEADSYTAQTEELVAMMLRHLEDEEDLIVPVILDQGERKLGLA
jgi:hemerythrin-like domain-containing protein